MTTITVTISDENHHKIVLPILYKHLEWLIEGRETAIHEEDKKMYKKDIKALKRTIDYFGGKCV
jgi:hypothetical protein